MKKRLLSKLQNFHNKYSLKNNQEIRLQVAKQNFKSIFIILHIVFLFGLINLIPLIAIHSNDLLEYHSQLIYFGLFTLFSFMDIMVYIIIKFMLKSESIILLNMPLYLAFIAVYFLIIYGTVTFGSILTGVLLLSTVSLVILIFMNVHPVAFIAMIIVPFVEIGNLILKQKSTSAFADLILLFVVLCALAFYKRISVVSTMCATSRLEDQKKKLEKEYSRQSAEIETQAIELIRQNRKLMKIQDETIISLSNLVENRDSDTGGHVKRTSKYVNILANAAFHKHLYPEIIDEDFIELVTKAAPLHDIGKIIVPDAILKKPGRLEDNEFEMIKRHASEGGKIVQEVLGVSDDPNYVEMAKNIAMYHHEKWNGKGYPCGINGDEIPLCARLMAVADVYDALVSKRCYKQAMTFDEATEIIKVSSGSHFDPVLVDLFLEKTEDFKEIAERYKD